MRIEHINDVLPHIAGREDFIVVEKDGYTVIDYVFTLPDSFDHPARVECRGIKFAPDGRILARPFQKFHNVNEKAHTQAGLIDMSRPHLITEKIDGSMIHPAVVNGELVFMTRMGRTDVAKWAEELLTPAMGAEMRQLLDDGCTPIFEFTSLRNRVIIRHERPRLHLLAVRHTIDGTYPFQNSNSIATIARQLGVEAVPFHSSEWKTMLEFVDFVRAIEGKEGFVVTFEDGLWLKMKGDDYVLKHKSKDATQLEKNVLAMILTDTVDDVLPLLEDEYRNKVECYRVEVENGIAMTAETVQTLVDKGASMDQKTFAVEGLRYVSPFQRALAFQLRAGRGSALDLVKAGIMKNVGSQAEVDEVRPYFGAKWE